MDKLEIHFYEQSHIKRLVSPMRNQLSADVFMLMTKYAWFPSDSIHEDPALLVSVNHVSFARLGTCIRCEEKGWDKSIFITLARYANELYFQHFLSAIISIKNTGNIFTNHDSAKLLYRRLYHKLLKTYVKNQNRKENSYFTFLNGVKISAAFPSFSKF